MSSGHSLIFGNSPGGEHLATITKAIAAGSTSGLESLGLFDSTSPNYTTFYPDASAEDWTPKDEDFVYPLFRLFSETIVVKWGTPIDFSKEGVVSSSIGKLVGATLNPDHESKSVGNALGAIKEVEWQKGYTANGVKVPAGVLGRLKLDAKSNPRIARGVMMNPPSIHSISVTVRFDWEKSHPDMEDFWEKVGSYDKDGELIRLIVSNIISYPEVSLVHHGADPYAQKVDDNGIINNPKYASTVYSLSAEEDKQGGLHCSLDFKGLCSMTNENPIFNKQNSNTMDLKQMLTILGLAEDAFATQEELVAHFKALEASHSALKGIAKKLSLDEDTGLVDDTMGTAIQDLMDNQLPKDAKLITPEVEALVTGVREHFGEGVIDFEAKAALASDGEAFLTSLRDDAARLYKLVAGEEKADATILKTIENASLEEAKSFKAMYEGLADSTAPLTCQKCGSSDVSRASFKKDPKDPKENSFEDTKKEIVDKHKRKASDVHGE